LASLKVISFILINLFTIGANGQTAIIPAGGECNNSYGNISYTIGDIFYTSKGSDYNISEGEQHIYIINVFPLQSKIQMIPYPNPTHNLLYFKVENNNYTDLSYILYDLNGKVIRNGFIKSQYSFINLKELPSQTYMLKCYRGKVEENIFEIIKVN
jgi:hypothetical protein